MQYRKYGKLGYEVSALGLGCMRLPRIYDGSGQAQVDREKSFELIRYAVENGINYFDTAYSYHNKDSEAVLGEALDYKDYREKVKIVTKQPLNAMTTQADIRKNLENTLKKLRTDYLDVYLIHNIQQGTWGEVLERDIIGEYEKFKQEGLIKAIGFSYHGQFPAFSEILGAYDWDMCQVQQNMLDVDHEVTAQSIEAAGKKGCALVVMEPLRGGGLANAPDRVKALYDAYPVKRSAAEWAFRHVLDYPAVSTILSGMTTMEQLKENIAIFSKPDAVANCLSEEEKAIIAKAKEAYESFVSIPCTACEYCLPCPAGVKIPEIFSKYNAGMMFEDFEQPKRSYSFTTNAKGDATQCVECGICETKCPQHLKIIEDLKVAHESLKGWVE